MKLPGCGSAARQSFAGMTLLEVVLAVAIFVVIGTLGYTALLSLLRTSVTLEEARDELTVAVATLGRLSRELQLAYDRGRPLLPDPRDPESQRSTTGRSIFLRSTTSNDSQSQQRRDTISFLALDAAQYFPDGGAQSGVVQITYRIAPDPDSPNGVTLVREEMPALADAEEAARRLVVFPVSKKVIGLEFSFFSRREGRWSSTWGDRLRERLPAIIQASVVTRSDPTGPAQRYTTTVSVQ